MFENVSYTHPLIMLTYLVVTVGALITLWRSPLNLGQKVAWAVVIIILPLVGPVAWWIALATHYRKAHISA